MSTDIIKEAKTIKEKTTMKEKVAAVLGLTLLTGILAGCVLKTPSDKETADELEDMYGGEEFEVEDGTAYSKDRDLEFDVKWINEGKDIGFDFHAGYKLALETTYFKAVYEYWRDDYLDCFDKYDFEEVEYDKKMDQFGSLLLNIYIVGEPSDSEIRDIESLLEDIREICEEEQEFHDHDYKSHLTYSASIYIIDEYDDEYQVAEDIDIRYDTKDKDLKFKNMDFKDESGDPRDRPLNNGNVNVYVN